MAHILKDRVRDTTTTVGTGALTLSGTAPVGFQSFGVAGLATNDTTFYCVANQTGTEWETGLGTYSSVGPTLTRTTVFESSNAGAAVSFSAGTKDVFITIPASRDIRKNNAGTVDGLTYSAGAATLAPITLTSGTNLTTAAAGSIEYDGKVIYGTPQGTQRGVIPSQMYYRLNTAFAGTNATGAQSIFGVGVTLSANTVYRFESQAAFNKTAGATSHNFSLLFGGLATVTNIEYHLLATSAAAANPGTVTSHGYISATSAVNLAAVIATAAWNVSYRIIGTVSIGASGGTFIPQYSLSAAPGGAYSTVIGSDFLIYPVGTTGSNINVGGWA